MKVTKIIRSGSIDTESGVLVVYGGLKWFVHRVTGASDLNVNASVGFSIRKLRGRCY